MQKQPVSYCHQEKKNPFSGILSITREKVFEIGQGKRKGPAPFWHVFQKHFKSETSQPGQVHKALRRQDMEPGRWAVFPQGSLFLWRSLRLSLVNRALAFE